MLNNIPFPKAYKSLNCIEKAHNHWTSQRLCASKNELHPMVSIKRRWLVKSAPYTDVFKRRVNEHNQAPFLSSTICIYNTILGSDCQYKKQSEQWFLLFLAEKFLIIAVAHLKCSSLPKKAGYRHSFEIIGKKSSASLCIFSTYNKVQFSSCQKHIDWLVNRWYNIRITQRRTLHA